MSAASNIVINDGATTPVAHTFNYSPVGGDVHGWEDRVSGIYVGFNRITLTMRRPATKLAPVIRVRIKIETPILETLSNNSSGLLPAPQAAYGLLADMEFVLPVRATLQDRKNLRSFVSNLLGNAHMINAVENLELPW